MAEKHGRLVVPDRLSPQNEMLQELAPVGPGLSGRVVCKLCHMWLFGGRRRPGPVRGGMWPPALLGSGASGVSVPLVRGSDCPPVFGFCPGDSLTSSLEG